MANRKKKSADDVADASAAIIDGHAEPQNETETGNQTETETQTETVNTESRLHHARAVLPYIACAAAVIAILIAGLAVITAYRATENMNALEARLADTPKTITQAELNAMEAGLRGEMEKLTALAATLGDNVAALESRIAALEENIIALTANNNGSKDTGSEPAATDTQTESGWTWSLKSLFGKGLKISKTQDEEGE